jgi:hypothetical protein
LRIIRFRGLHGVTTLSKETKRRIELWSIASFVGAATLTGILLFAVHPAFTPVAIVFGQMAYAFQKGRLNYRAESELHSLADATWIRRIGPLIEGVENAAYESTRQSEIAELTRILPHVRYHHRQLVDDQHIRHLLHLVLQDSQKSPEFFRAGLVAIGHLGWIEAIEPLEELGRNGTGTTTAPKPMPPSYGRSKVPVKRIPSGCYMSLKKSRNRMRDSFRTRNRL